MFFFKRKTADEGLGSLVGSQMCRRDRNSPDWIGANTWYKTALAEYPDAQANEGTKESIPRNTRADLQDFGARLSARVMRGIDSGVPSFARA